MKKYSASTNGFYEEEIHGDAVPSDCVEIEEAYYEELINGQSAGKVIVADDRGFPRLADKQPLTPEEQQKKTNREKKNYLASTDWYIVRRAETGEEIPQDVLDARAAARLSIVE